MSEYIRKEVMPMTLFFDIVGMIDDNIFIQLQDFIRTNQNAQEPVEHLHLSLNSLGGSVPSAIMLYNFLKQLPFTVSTHNLAEISSAAILPFLAGSTRTTENFSKFMIHPVTFSVNGDLTYYKSEEIFKSISADISNYAKIVNFETQNLNGKYDVLHHLKSDSLFLDCTSAYECGITTAQ